MASTRTCPRCKARIPDAEFASHLVRCKGRTVSGSGSVVTNEVVESVAREKKNKEIKKKATAARKKAAPKKVIGPELQMLMNKFKMTAEDAELFLQQNPNYFNKGE
ncbi:hypothetical protein [Flammeovirga sp. SJP92]|uniref:hypothetical protein n=1 Tax=Flammeovirga sp. SJP92 TaxID=1775430 RepID=UPI0007892DB8|nr:hypothetical protein [Flammeovirga sp. SJP92]KXX69486.1 hypothetical protein AVL50_15545 [Flammeovirga sp. SJP92]